MKVAAHSAVKVSAMSPSARISTVRAQSFSEVLGSGSLDQRTLSRSTFAFSETGMFGTPRSSNSRATLQPDGPPANHMRSATFDPARMKVAARTLDSGAPEVTKSTADRQTGVTAARRAEFGFPTPSNDQSVVSSSLQSVKIQRDTSSNFSGRRLGSVFPELIERRKRGLINLLQLREEPDGVGVEVWAPESWCGNEFRMLADFSLIAGQFGVTLASLHVNSFPVHFGRCKVRGGG